MASAVPDEDASASNLLSFRYSFAAGLSLPDENKPELKIAI